jgi:DNA-binding NarL/FixJ family response regulator
MRPHPYRLPEDKSRTEIIRTLLVDDSPFMLKTLAQILAREGNFTVVGAATDGCQALRYALALAPDLILMDLHLPHLNGAQATRNIKQFVKPPIVFLMTLDDSSSSRTMSKAAGADAFIVKSGDLDAQLRSKLREWCGSAANPARPSGKQKKSL